MPPGSAGTGTDTSTGAATQARTVPQDRAEIDLSFAPLVKQTAGAVVNVYAERVVQRQPVCRRSLLRAVLRPAHPDPTEKQSSLGSGVIVSAGGLVVTNNHVIEGADDVKIALADGREYPSECC